MLLSILYQNQWNSCRNKKYVDTVIVQLLVVFFVVFKAELDLRLFPAQFLYKLYGNWAVSVET